MDNETRIQQVLTFIDTLGDFQACLVFFVTTRDGCDSLQKNAIALPAQRESLDKIVQLPEFLCFIEDDEGKVWLEKNSEAIRRELYAFTEMTFKY
jgi:hypothetical protein